MSDDQGNSIALRSGIIHDSYTDHGGLESNRNSSNQSQESRGLIETVTMKDVNDEVLADPIETRDSSIMESEPHIIRIRTRQNQLSRKLEERHVNMFAFSLLVGSGLFLQNGRIIYLAGPGAAFLIYPVMIVVIWAVMGALGEMTALFPVPGALFELPARFLDVSIGYAAGWMAWFSWVVIFAAELAAVATLFQFRFDPEYLQQQRYPEPTLQWSTYSYDRAIWVSLIWILSILINLLPIRLYGEFEYIVGSIKMCFCVVIILFQVIINIQTHTDGMYYRSPYSFLTQSFTSLDGDISRGSLAQLQGIWTGFCVAIYSVIGFESISITAAESMEFDERKHFATKEGMKISTRKIAIRIMMVYTISTLVVSLNVPVDDPNLKDANLVRFGGGQNSAFVIAAVRAGKTVWPDLMTGFFVFTTTSASINSLYLSSRLLHALALSRPVWPDYYLAVNISNWLQEVTRNGVPRNAMLASSAFGLLGYLATTGNHGEALSDLAGNSCTSMLIVYVVICATFIRFKSSLQKKLGSFHSAESGHQRGNARIFDRDSRNTYPYKSRAQPLRAILAGFVCVGVIIFGGWQSISPFRIGSFLASYISIIVFLTIFVAYRVREWRQPGIKFWKLSPTGDMRRPTTVERAPGNPGRDHLNLDIDNLLSLENFRKTRKWIWVWLQ